MRRLELAGHEVIAACPKAVGEKVQAQGFEYVQLLPVNYDPAPKVPNFQGLTGKMKRFLYQIRHKKSRQKAAIAALGMNDFEQKLKEIQPDLLLLDVELHEHITTAVAKKWPTILLSQWFSLWHRKGLPPLLHDTIPDKGWRGSKVGLWWTWWKLKRQRWWIFWKKKIRSGSTNRRAILQKYAAQVGFPKRYIRENYWPGPFVYGELPVLNMVAEELEFPHNVRPNSYYIGPMVFENRADIRSNSTVEKQLEALFLEKKRANKKLIYCSVSTYRKGDTSFLKKLVEAVQNREDWLLVLGLGGQLDTHFLQPLPENVHAFAWIPQLKVLAEADLSINHGGIHTINECVYFGVPMLVYSGKRSDQNGCAARVHFHEIGVMADKDVDTVAAIEKRIEAFFLDEKYKNNVAKIQAISENYKTEKRLEQLVNQHVSQWLERI